MKGILKSITQKKPLNTISLAHITRRFISIQNFLEVEIITDDSLDHVEDDSLQYNFPQLSLDVLNFLMILMN